jgi:hypothetical protein
MNTNTPALKQEPPVEPRCSVDEKSFPQTAELAGRIEAERARGLKDVKFFANRPGGDVTVESFCGEINQMLKSPEVPDSDLI